MKTEKALIVGQLRIIKTSFMKTKAFIEIGNGGTYSVYIENSTLNYGIHGTGKTVKESVEDFLYSYKEMKDFFNEKGKEFIETTFEFHYDVASFLEYYGNILVLIIGYISFSKLW